MSRLAASDSAPRPPSLSQRTSPLSSRHSRSSRGSLPNLRSSASTPARAGGHSGGPRMRSQSLLDSCDDISLRDTLQRDIDAAAKRAAKLASSILEDDRPPPDPPPPPYTQGATPGLIEDVGETDPERVRPHPRAVSGASAGLQHKLLHALDIAGVKTVVDGTPRLGGVGRQAEMRSPLRPRQQQHEP